jgi:hypothetical protein
MKKVLIGVGIGCGGLMVLALVGLVGGTWWLKGKVEGFAGGMTENTEKIEALNRKHAFTAPPRGHPVRLTDARLNDYLAVRGVLTPVFKKYEAQAEKFKDQDSEQAKAGDALEARSIVGNLLAELQRTWLAALDQRNMSPDEFGAITAAVYASPLAQGMEQMREGHREVLTRLREEQARLAEDPSASQEMQDLAREQVEALDEQLASLPESDPLSPEARKLHQENAALLERMKAIVQRVANPGVDLLLGSFGGGKAFQNAFEGLGQ